MNEDFKMRLPPTCFYSMVKDNAEARRIIVQCEEFGVKNDLQSLFEIIVEYFAQNKVDFIAFSCASRVEQNTVKYATLLLIMRYVCYVLDNYKDSAETVLNNILQCYEQDKNFSLAVQITVRDLMQYYNNGYELLRFRAISNVFRLVIV